MKATLMCIFGSPPFALEYKRVLPVRYVVSINVQTSCCICLIRHLRVGTGYFRNFKLRYATGALIRKEKEVTLRVFSELDAVVIHAKIIWTEFIHEKPRTRKIR